jgi:FkbM family methyltransferase
LQRKISINDAQNSSLNSSGVLKRRWALSKYFSLTDVVVLFLGKLIPLFRSKHFLALQDRENKLGVLSKSAALASVSINEAVVNFTFNEKFYTCTLRLQGSDVWVFNQVICTDEYNYVVKYFIHAFQKEPYLIVDAGANIGLTTILFKAMLPHSKIISLEPDESNYEMAKTNLHSNSFNNVTIMPCALWPTSTNLEIINDFRDKLEWSIRVQESKHGNIKSITPKEVVSYLGGSVDIFKIDIEGGESNIFDAANDVSWLTNVKIIAVEIHDEYNAREKIISLLERNKFMISHHGELTIAINTNG